MKFFWRTLAVLAVTGAVLGLGSIVRDRHTLNTGLVRLHVVGASDRREDQQVKLQVRDAVLEVIAGLERPENPQEALTLLGAKLSELEEAANGRLRSLGSNDQARVTLGREAFPLREYDGFTLPAGVYESLRVQIGTGEGKNWWCVVFPQLCTPEAAPEAVAAGAGFSGELTRAITAPDYTPSFFLLEALGRVESFLFGLFR